MKKPAQFWVKINRLVLDSDPRRVTKTGSAQTSDPATDPADDEPDTDDPSAEADNDPAQAAQQD